MFVPRLAQIDLQRRRWPWMALLAALVLAWSPAGFADWPSDSDAGDRPARDEESFTFRRMFGRDPRTRLEECMYELAGAGRLGSVAYEDALAMLRRRQVPQATAEDLVQDALLATCTKHHARAIRELRPYYFKTVQNLLARLYRERTLTERARTFLSMACDLGNEDSADREEVDALVAAYKKLKQSEQEVLSLHLELENHAAVARELGISHDAARQRHSRAMAHLEAEVRSTCQ